MTFLLDAMWGFPLFLDTVVVVDVAATADRTNIILWRKAFEMILLHRQTAVAIVVPPFRSGVYLM